MAKSKMVAYCRWGMVVEKPQSVLLDEIAAMYEQGKLADLRDLCETLAKGVEVYPEERT